MALSKADQRKLMRELEGRSRAQQSAIINSTFDKLNAGVKDPLNAALAQVNSEINKAKSNIAAGFYNGAGRQARQGRVQAADINFDSFKRDQYGTMRGSYNNPVVGTKTVPAFRGRSSKQVAQYKYGGSSNTGFINNNTAASAWLDGLRQYEKQKATINSRLKETDANLATSRADSLKDARKQLRLADLRKNQAELLFGQPERRVQQQGNGFLAKASAPIQNVGKGFSGDFNMQKRLT